MFQGSPGGFWARAAPRRQPQGWATRHDRPEVRGSGAASAKREEVNSRSTQQLTLKTLAKAVRCSNTSKTKTVHFQFQVKRYDSHDLREVALPKLGRKIQFTQEQNRYPI